MTHSMKYALNTFFPVTRIGITGNKKICQTYYPQDIYHLGNEIRISPRILYRSKNAISVKERYIEF